MTATRTTRAKSSPCPCGRRARISAASCSARSVRVCGSPLLHPRPAAAPSRARLHASLSGAAPLLSRPFRIFIHPRSTYLDVDISVSVGIRR